MLPPLHLAHNLPPLQACDVIMPVMLAAFPPEYGEAWNTQQVLAQLVQPNTTSVIARSQNGDSVGFAIGRQILDEMELLLFAVDPDHQGKGIGSALLHRFLEMCRAQRVKLTFLEMRTNNPAFSIYEKFGFREVGRRKNYYRGHDGQRYDACTMSLEIG
jgi:[ribosomal protein S18]-alanine N-acetyltransferase